MRLTRLGAAVASVALVATGPLATSAGASTGHAVTMANYAFSPAALTVQVGDTVTWTNTDQAPHDVTTTSGPVSIHSSMMMKGQTWRYTFTTPGTYSYICSIHPDMHATVVVKAAPTTPPPPPTSHAPAPKAHSATTTLTHPAPMHSAPITSAAHSSTAVAAPAPPPASTSAAPVAATTTSSGGKLKPLLFVAGIVAALATLCLLMLAARPDSAPTA